MLGEFSDDPQARAAVPVLIETLATDPKRYAFTHATADEHLQRIVFGKAHKFGTGDIAAVIKILTKQLRSESARLRKRAKSALEWLRAEEVNDIRWFSNRYTRHLK